jgi:HEAT repeat protein
VLRKDPESLIAALGSTASRERENAANALSAVADPRAEKPLLEALADPDACVRGQAALAIGSLGSRPGVPRLLELTQDQDWFVRVAALNGLGYIDPALPAEPALAALGDDEPLVRQAAALNIGGSTDPAAVDVLVEALVARPRLECPRGGRRRPRRDRRPAGHGHPQARRTSLAGDLQPGRRPRRPPRA